MYLADMETVADAATKEFSGTIIQGINIKILADTATVDTVLKCLMYYQFVWKHITEC